MLFRSDAARRGTGAQGAARREHEAEAARRRQRSSSWAGTWLSRDTASSASPRRSRRTNSDFRWTLHRSGSSTSFGGLDGSGGVAGRLRPISGLLGHGHPSQLHVPTNRVDLVPPASSPALDYIEANCRYFRPRMNVAGSHAQMNRHAADRASGDAKSLQTDRRLA